MVWPGPASTKILANPFALPRLNGSPAVWRSCRNPSVAAFASTPSKILRLWIFQERDFIVRATDFPTVTAAVTSASHDSVVNALPLEVPHPPDSKQRKNEFTLDMSR